MQRLVENSLVDDVAGGLGFRVERRLFLIGEDSDGLDGNAFLTYPLVLGDFGGTAVDKMVVAYLDKLRLLLGIIVYGRIVGEELLVLFELRVRNRDSRNQRTGVGVEREIEKLLRIGNFHNVAL